MAIACCLTILNPYAMLTPCHIMVVFGSSPGRQLAGQAAIPASRDQNRMPGNAAWARQHCPTPNQTRPTPNKQAHADCQSMRHIQPMCTQTNGALACSAHTAITAQWFRPYSLQLSFFSFLFTSYIHHCTPYTLNLTNIIHHDHPQILVLGQTYNAVLGH